MDNIAQRVERKASTEFGGQDDYKDSDSELKSLDEWEEELNAYLPDAGGNEDKKADFDEDDDEDE